MNAKELKQAILQLSQSTHRDSILQNFERIASFGPDAIEAVPVCLQTAWKTHVIMDFGGGGVVHPVQVLFGIDAYYVANSKGLQVFKAYGVPGASITVFWLAHHLGNLGVTPLEVALTVIDSLISFGADGADVLPVLENHCKALKGASVSGLTAEKISLLQAAGMSGDDVSRFNDATVKQFSGQLNAATEKITAIIRKIEISRAQTETHGPPSLRSQGASLIEGFVTRSLKQRSSTFIHAADISVLADRLTAEIQKECSDLPASEANDITMTSLSVQCPVCGQLRDDSRHLLYLAARGALAEGVIGDTVIPAGTSGARLMKCDCPGCAGHYLIVTFDPSGLPTKRSGSISPFGITSVSNSTPQQETVDATGPTRQRRDDIVLCPHCRKKLIWRSERAGQVVSCPLCQGLLTFPLQMPTPHVAKVSPAHRNERKADSSAQTAEHPAVNHADVPAIASPPGSTFEMPIEDVFVIKGRGTVVTGCITKGFVRQGEQIIIRKSNGTERSTACEIEGMSPRSVKAARAGDHVGILLRKVSKADVDRGDLLFSVIEKQVLSEKELQGKPDRSCFIATACYGSADCPEVRTLRCFRDQVLLPYLSGQVLIQLYYLLSPPLARWLSARPWLRVLVRDRILAPFVKYVSSRNKM